MRILVVKIGAIGDVVMALPLIPAIRQKWPQAHITWICGQQVLPLLQRTEGIDQLIAVDETRLLKGSIFQKIGEIGRIWRMLALSSFDLGLYYYFSPAYRVFTALSRVKTWKGFSKSGSKRLNPIPGQHHSWAYVNTILELEGARMDLLSYPAFRFLNPIQAPQAGAIRVALACGGARNLLRDDDLRRWPVESYRKLGQRIVDAGYTLVLTGSPGDAWVRESFSGIPFEDEIGTRDLPGFVELLHTCDLLITHDSGPLHLADLGQCPVLGLFGPTIPQEKASLHPLSAWIWGGEHLHCRPCYDGREYGRCTESLCLRSVSEEAVWKKACEILAKK